MRSGDGWIGTPQGYKRLECPVEYLILRAVRYLNGAMKPQDFAPSRSAAEWIEYALMAEAVENEIVQPKEGQGGSEWTTFEIIPESEGGEPSAPMQLFQI